MLEKKLNVLDRDERQALFLATCRDDGNQERKSILKTLSVALAEYGKGKDI